MKQKWIEKQLKQETSQIMRDVDLAIKHVHFKHPSKKTISPRRFLLWSASLSLAVVALIALIVVPFTQAKTYITLAVNPHVQLVVNQQEKIEQVEGLNQDGVVLVYQEDFKGLTLNLGLTKLLGLYQEYGFFDHPAQIQLLVYNKIAKKEQTLLNRSLTSLQAYVSQHATNAQVIALNQQQRALAFVQEQLQDRGIPLSQVRSLPLPRLLKMYAQFDEEEIQGVRNELKDLFDTILSLPPPLRGMALANIKRNRFHKDD